MRLWNVLQIQLLVFASSLLFVSLETIRSSHADDGEAYFETNIRPLLVAHCIACHNSDKQEGGLRLDYADGFRAGGEGGAIVDWEHREDANASHRLLNALRYVDLEMPPKGKLSDEQIELFETWVELGAPWPSHNKPLRAPTAREFTAEERNYWCFQPLPTASQIPTTPSDTSQMNPIDRFVESKLSEQGLHIAESADRHVLARRAYLDLLGVPPTDAEIRSFESDPRSTQQAFASLVDQLLDDPRYGERFGRYWLDLVHMPNRMDTNKTIFDRRPIVIATMSSEASMKTNLTVNSSSNNWLPTSLKEAISRRSTQ